MPQMHYLATNFQKSPSDGAFRLQRRLTFNEVPSFSQTAFSHLAKLWFLKLIMTKSNFKI